MWSANLNMFRTTTESRLPMPRLMFIIGGIIIATLGTLVGLLLIGAPLAALIIGVAAGLAWTAAVVELRRASRKIDQIVREETNDAG